MTPERIVKFTPAFNRTDPAPSKNYGIGAVRIWFYLKGPLAVVQFQISTQWYLPGDRDAMLGRPYEIPEPDPERLQRMRQMGSIFGPPRETRKVVLCDYYSVKDTQAPEGWDVGYHSPVALYQDQSPMSSCEFFPAPAKCFYDGSSLRAETWAAKFVEGGTDWLWPEMERELRDIEARVAERLEDEKRFS